MASTTLKPSWRTDVTPYLVYLLLIATLGPLQFGFHMAELNPPKAVLTCQQAPSAPSDSRLPACIPMSESQFGLVNSIYTLGGFVGAVSAGPFTTRTGRLLSMRLTGIFFVLGPALAALAPSVAILASGRFFSGLGSGASLVVVPMYIAEIVPSDSKGMFGALTQVMCNLGILIALVLGYFLSYGSMWRVILSVAGALGALQGLGLLLAVESPVWLGAKGRAVMAKKTLKRIRGRSVGEEAPKLGSSEAAESESQSLLASDANSAPNGGRNSKPSVGILAVVTHPEHYKAIIAVISVMFAQQFTGINGVMMYSVSFLSVILPTGATLITVMVGALNLVVTIACAPLSDRVGRKRCLLLSIFSMSVNSVLLAVGIINGYQALAAVATLLFVASFAVGLGPVPFILASELVGPEAVGATQSWALAANWFATFLVAQFFPMLNDFLGQGKVFFVFAAMGAALFAFIAWWVPETLGKTADEAWGRGERDRRED